MSVISEKIITYFQYPFVVYAFIVGVLIALCSSLFGVTLVLKRFSFIGDGLSHVAFGAVAVAAVLNITNSMFFVLPVTVVAAIIILRKGENSKVKGDASIAMLSVGALAIGYLIMNIFSASANLSGDVCSALFGSALILTLTEGEVWLSVVLSVAVISLFLLFYRHIFSITFDEDFASTTGISIKKYNLFIAVIIAVIIVLAMKLVGSLLISALIIFPALSAMCVCRGYKSVVIFSCIISVVTTAAGIITAVVFSTPVGATIAAVDIAAYALCTAMSGLLRFGR